jgi:hypothetical protein
MSQTARLHPAIRTRLSELKTALENEEGVSATQEDIIAALIHGTTLPQLMGMLPAFKRHAASAEKKSGPPHQ